MSNPHRPYKAYLDPEFINSPAARSIRILSEYLAPYTQFKREKVRDTIVFFGSARALPVGQAERIHQELSRSLEGSPQPGGGLAKLEFAKLQVKLARYYEEAVELARMLTTWSKSLGRNSRRFVICSGGGPGIMEAANRGARLAGGKTVGLNIALPFEQVSNPYVSEELNFDFHYFFMRKYWFVYLAKALVFFPGGFGTLDELAEVLTLLQTRKITKKLVVLLYGSPYWNETVNFNSLVRWGTISPEDLSLFQYADTPKQAFDILKAGLEKLYLHPQKEQPVTETPDVKI
jgi:uncharacterized protein (TIGR00730 family)